MSIGISIPTPTAEMTITQSRLENLKRVSHKNPKNKIRNTTIS
jgi:hypothetical protein